MAANILTNPLFRAFDASGNPLAGGKLYTYKAGTSTPKATYTDANLTTPHTNPVILDAEGSAVIWLDGSYKLDLYSSTNVQQNDYPIDNVSSFVQDYELYTTTGTANNYLVTTNNTITAYETGFTLDVKFNVANTGASTINVDGLGIKSITKEGSLDVVSGDLNTTKIYKLQYDGTRFQITNAANISQNDVFIKSAAPYIQFYDTNGGSDVKYSEVVNEASFYKIRFLNDAYSAANDPVIYSRSGYTCTGQTYTVSSGNFNYNAGFRQEYTTLQTNDMYLNAATSNGQSIATYDCYARDSASNKQFYAGSQVEAVSTTSGSENGAYNTWVVGSGSATKVVSAGFSSAGNKVFSIHGTDLFTSGEKVIAQLRCNASTGTPTIVSSFGVSSITDNGVGDFTINLSTTVASATHVYALISVGLSGVIMPAGFISTITTSSVRVTTRKWTSGTTEAAADLSDDFFVTVYARVY